MEKPQEKSFKKKNPFETRAAYKFPTPGMNHFRSLSVAVVVVFQRSAGDGLLCKKMQ